MIVLIQIFDIILTSLAGMGLHAYFYSRSQERLKGAIGKAWPSANSCVVANLTKYYDSQCYQLHLQFILLSVVGAVLCYVVVAILMTFFNTIPDNTPMATAIAWLMINAVISPIRLYHKQKYIQRELIDALNNDDPSFADNYLATLKHEGLRSLNEILYLEQSISVILRFIELLSKNKEHEQYAKCFIFTLSQIKGEMPMLLIEENWPANMKRLFLLPDLNFTTNKESDAI